MKSFLLIHYFLVNLVFLLVGFLSPLKIYHVRLFIMEKMEFGMTPRRCGIHSKPQPLLQKTCLFMSLKPQLCTHALGHVRRLLPTYVSQGPLWSFYFQKQIFAHLKSYIFHFNTSQVNLISDWALNQPWALEFEHHWGTGARVIRCTKCGVYNTSVWCLPNTLR